MANKKLLYVDDDLNNRKFIELAFKPLNIDLWLAEDGKHALDQYEEVKPDLILTDLYMPNMNGIQLFVEIRKNDNETPIIAFTGADFEDDDDDIHEIGFDEIVHKPVSNDKLTELLNKYLK